MLFGRMNRGERVRSAPRYRHNTGYCAEFIVVGLSPMRQGPGCLETGCLHAHTPTFPLHSDASIDFENVPKSAITRTHNTNPKQPPANPRFSHRRSTKCDELQTSASHGNLRQHSCWLASSHLDCASIWTRHKGPREVYTRCACRYQAQTISRTRR